MLETTFNSSSDIWIIGCGNIGRRVARLYQIDGIQTRAIARSKESVELAQAENIDTIQFDLDDRQQELPQLENADVFYFTPPPPQGKVDTRLQHFLDMCGRGIRRLVLISTTGVYGDSHGEWIDETSTAQPQADRAYRRLDAEQTLQQWAISSKSEYVILRVPGIYALDRLPLVRLKKGLPVVNEAEAPWTNRIHADDLAAVCKQAMQQREINHEIINVTDSKPSNMTVYFNQVADYVGLARPPQISLAEAEQQLSAGMLSYMQESRRISNRKMLELLDVELQYPSLESCLKK